MQPCTWCWGWPGPDYPLVLILPGVQPGHAFPLFATPTIRPCDGYKLWRALCLWPTLISVAIFIPIFLHSNDFSRAVAEEYLSFFQFEGQSLDCALR